MNVNVNPSGGAVHFGSKFAKEKEEEDDAAVATTSAKIQVLNNKSCPSGGE